ncbi:hypothetical protein Q3G72_009032 [Acer saccharum]|nr:hypothetical protein Q3G72_009032 [Acer saccharum]
MRRGGNWLVHFSQNRRCSTISTVVKGWSAAALQSKEAAVEVCFPAASIFPPMDTYIPPMKLVRDKYVTRRFVFDASKIAALKTKAASSMVQQLTRVEAVTALVWKCMMNMSRQIKGYPRLTMLSHSVDLRKKIVPPLPENSIGNMVGMFFPVETTEKDIHVAGLVCKLRKAKREFAENGLRIISVEKRTWQKNKQEMAVFESDQQLLAFAAINPTVSNP